MVYRITMLYNTIQYNTIQYNVVLAWCERTLCVLFDDLRRALPLVGVFAFNCFNLFNSICSIQFVQFNLFQFVQFNCSIQFNLRLPLIWGTSSGIPHTCACECHVCRPRYSVGIGLTPVGKSW